MIEMSCSSRNVQPEFHVLESATLRRDSYYNDQHTRVAYFLTFFMKSYIFVFPYFFGESDIFYKFCYNTEMNA